MKLYDYFRSSASFRVRIALNIKNINYDAIPVHLLKGGGEHLLPEYSQINPQCLVPTLEENNHIITQSLAIIEYLDEMIPMPSLLPQSPYDKARVRSLALSIACDIHPLNNLRVLNQLKTMFLATEEKTQEWYHYWLKKGFDALEQTLEKLPRQENVCFGDKVTLADLCLIPQVYNAKRYQFNLETYPLINAIYTDCMKEVAFNAAKPPENL